MRPDFELEFDPAIDLDPYTLFHRLQEGEPPRLLILSPTQPTFSSATGAQLWDPEDPLPSSVKSEEIVLVDHNGTTARPLARQLQEQGHPHVHALFGGVEFYDYCLDPRVVGAERFLEDEATSD